MRFISAGFRAAALLIALAVLAPAPEAFAKGGAKPSHANAHHAAPSRAPARHQAAPHVAIKPPRVMKPSAPRTVNRPQVNRQQVARSQVSRQQHSAAQRYNRRSYSRHRGYSYGYRHTSGYSNSRWIVRKLRATHSTLARIDRSYQGHRVRAMHAIARAIRQLEHRSGGSRFTAFAMPVGVRRKNNNNNVLKNGRPTLTQAQSDARMRRSLQTLRSIDGQLANNGPMVTYAQEHSRNWIRRAIRELNAGLGIK